MRKQNKSWPGTPPSRKRWNHETRHQVGSGKVGAVSNFWKEVLHETFNMNYLYGLITGFFLGQALIIILLILERLGLLR